MQASKAEAELRAENERLAGLLAEAEVAAEGAAQLRDALEAKNEAEVLQVQPSHESHTDLWTRPAGLQGSSCALVWPWWARGPGLTECSSAPREG